MRGRRQLLRRLLRGQEGQILPWAIMATMLGIFIVVPVAVLAGNAFRGSAKVEDYTRNYYAADAVVHAIIEDMIRGADLVPLPPNTYTAPTVDFGEAVPSVTVTLQETATLATVKPINYAVTGNPTVLVGFSPSGTGADLATDDNVYYKLSDAGTPPSLSYEVTSQVIQFPTVSFAELRLVALSTKSSTKVELFVHNPNDPLHTESGYNPIADTTVILELANTEQTFSFSLEDADITYLNTLSTKTIKLKVKATRSGGFRLDTDQIVFSVSGVVTTDERTVKGNPAINTGSLSSGSGDDLDRDDTAYYVVSSSGNVVEYEVTSENFSFSALDTVEVPFVARSNKSGVTIELFVHNPTDPAHTNGGYDTTPDLTATIPASNVDKLVNLNVAQADVTYLNTLNPIAMKLKVRASHSSAFQLQSDQLLFVAISNTAPGQVFRQVTQQYFDPGLKDPAFANVAAKEGYLLRVYNSHPGLLNVNWASHTADFQAAKTSVQVFRGIVLSSGAVVPPGKITAKPPSQDNDLLISVSSRPGEAFVRSGFIDVNTGLYTIVFFNDSSSTVITDASAATGNKEQTWVYAAAYKDYLVDVTVGKVGLKAVLRQIPGPTEPPLIPWSATNISWIENLVLIQSWEPYGNE